MNRYFMFMAAASGLLVWVPRVLGQTYSGTILYPLVGYSGITFGTQAAGGEVADPNSGYWNSTGARIDLTPSGALATQVYGTDGTNQVGSDSQGALLWSGTAASAVNLNPTQPINGISFYGTIAMGVGGMQQVGNGAFLNLNTQTGIHHALLWNGSAASVVDLNPNNYSNSYGFATDGTMQAGYAVTVSAPANHAMVWSGTAASAVDLNPSSNIESEALGVGDDEEVGYASMPAFNAALWTGTPGSFVDLNPNGYTLSIAEATNGEDQVGYADLNNTTHAAFWAGTADSFLDIEALLPATDKWQDSAAYSIDSSGNIFGIAEDTSGNWFAAEWTAVPEPATGALMLIFGGGVLMRRGKRCAR